MLPFEVQILQIRIFLNHPVSNQFKNAIRLLLTSQIKEFRRDLQNWLNYEPGFIQNEKLKLWMASLNGDADADELLREVVGSGLGALVDENWSHRSGITKNEKKAV